MKHDGPVLLAIAADVGRVQALRHHEIHLQGAALPVAPDRVGKHEFKLRPVEGAFAGVELELRAGGARRGHQRLLRLRPHLVGARPDLRAVGEFDHEFGKPKVLVYARKHPDERGGLGFDLLLFAEYVGVVLNESPNPHQAVERAGRLEPVARPELRHPQREVPVALLPVVVDLDVARAVHRLQRVDAPFLRDFHVHVHQEHVLVEFLPVPGSLPERAIQDHRRVDLDVPVLGLPPGHVLLQKLVDRPAARVPERHPRSLLLEMEQAHFGADPAVVALLRLLDHPQMLLEIVLPAECDAVDPLQHPVLGIPAPESAGNGGQLERVGRNLARVQQMRAPAEVLPAAVPVHPHRLALGNGLDQLHLVRLVGIGVVLDRLLPRPYLRAHRVLKGDDLLHLGFDLREVRGRERLLAVEIVEPAVVDDRSNRDLGFRPDFLHGAGHDVRQIVADEFKRRRLVGHRVDRDGAIGADRPLKVPVSAVQMRGNRFPAERRSDPRRDLGCGNAFAEFERGAVRKSQGYGGGQLRPRRFGAYGTPVCGSAQSSRAAFPVNDRARGRRQFPRMLDSCNAALALRRRLRLQRRGLLLRACRARPPSARRRQEQ